MSGRPGPDPAFLHNVPTAVSTSPSGISAARTLSSRTLSSRTLSSRTLSSRTLSSSIVTATSSFIPSAPSTISSRISSSTLSALISSTSRPTASPSSSLSSLYPYSPSTTLAIVFATFFAALIPYHFYLSIYTPYISKSVSQKHRYTTPLLIAAILSTVGFALRALSVSTESHRSSIGLYAASSTALIVAPIFVCATLYLLVTHLVRLCLPDGPGRVFLGISPQWIGRSFIASDVLSFVCQGAGIAIAASGGWRGKGEDVGKGILICGLVTQVMTFSVFLAVFTSFCLRVRDGRAEETRGQITTVLSGSDDSERKRRDFGFNPLVKQVVKGIWIASVLVEIRCVFRTIEFVAGAKGNLFQHEWPLWALEAVPMLVALFALGYYHPVKWLQQKRRSAFVDKHDRTVGIGLSR